MSTNGRMSHPKRMPDRPATSTAVLSRDVSFENLDSGQETIEPGELKLLQAIRVDLLNAQGVWSRISRHLADKYQLADGESISPETGEVRRVVHSRQE